MGELVRRRGGARPGNQGHRPGVSGVARVSDTTGRSGTRVQTHREPPEVQYANVRGPRTICPNLTPAPTYRPCRGVVECLCWQDSRRGFAGNDRFRTAWPMMSFYRCCIFDSGPTSRATGSRSWPADVPARQANGDTQYFNSGQSDRHASVLLALRGRYRPSVDAATRFGNSGGMPSHRDDSIHFSSVPTLVE